MKKIAIILVDWNGVEVTRECLRSLNLLNSSAEYSHRVILVDNASQDPVKKQLEIDFPDVIYFRNEQNLGFTGGNNTGMEFALNEGYDYILLLNNDTTVHPDFLKHLFYFMEAHPEVGATQPRIFFEHDKSLLWNGGNGFLDCFGHTMVYGYNQKSKPRYENIKEQPWLTACAIMINSNVFVDERVGFLNENFFTNYEDVDFSFRLKEFGYKLFYIPSSIVYHMAGYSTNARKKNKEGFTHPFMVYMNTRNRLFVIRGFSPWYWMPTIFIFHFFYFSMLLGYFLLRNRPQKFKKTLEAIRDGIFMEFKMKGLRS